jgi:CP family cyanate transporter-like MFS transporter
MAVPAMIALVAWLPQLGFRTLPQTTKTLKESLRDLGRSSVAWQVASFMGLQSLTFYVILAWLPEILQSRGLEASYSGWMLALSQGTGILGTMLVPTWAGRLRNQRPIIWVLGVLEGVSLLGMFSPVESLIPLWVSTIGFVLGGTFGLALLFIVLRTSDTETATELSGMAQSIGYLMASAGPILFGYLHDVARGWTVPVLFLVVVLIAKIVTGLGAGRPLRVGR